METVFVIPQWVQQPENHVSWWCKVQAESLQAQVPRRADVSAQVQRQQKLMPPAQARSIPLGIFVVVVVAIVLFRSTTDWIDWDPHIIRLSTCFDGIWGCLLGVWGDVCWECEGMWEVKIQFPGEISSFQGLSSPEGSPWVCQGFWWAN